MLSSAVLVFSAVALIGLYMASRVLRGRFAPWAVSLLHALLGATGLLLLLGDGMLKGVTTRPVLLSFLLFLITAVGGFFLASFHLRQLTAPKVVVVVHAVIGLGAFATLLDASGLIRF